MAATDPVTPEPRLPEGTIAGMSEERRPTFGFLICGMVIVLSLGLMAAKQDHNALWLIVGAMVGTIAGGFLESFAHHRK